MNMVIPVPGNGYLSLVLKFNISTSNPMILCILNKRER